MAVANNRNNIVLELNPKPSQYNVLLNTIAKLSDSETGNYIIYLCIHNENQRFIQEAMTRFNNNEFVKPLNSIIALMTQLEKDKTIVLTDNTICHTHANENGYKCLILNNEQYNNIETIIEH